MRIRLMLAGLAILAFLIWIGAVFLSDGAPRSDGASRSDGAPRSDRVVLSEAVLPSSDIADLRAKAEAGDAASQTKLGWRYANGDGVAEDSAIAVSWYRKAAQQGDIEAQYNLGWRYSVGAGVAEDDILSVLWYRKAAEQGDVRSQTNLGLFYSNGVGVSKNRIKAYMWSSLAASRGDEVWSRRASEVKENLSQEMTASEISQAESLARECLANNYKKCS